MDTITNKQRRYDWTLIRGRVEQTFRQQFPHLIHSKASFRIWGVPRGGIHVAQLLGELVPEARMVDSPEEADVIVDDIVDSGETRDLYLKKFPGKAFYAPVDKTIERDAQFKDDWIVFPWEGDEPQGAESNVRRLLQLIGENPRRPGLKDTPKRFIKAMREHTEGYSKDPKDVLGVSFDLTDAHQGAVYDQIIMSGPLPFSSMCEHHLAPFEGVAWIGYLPGETGRVVGLSKLARVLDIFAKRLQVQERLTVQIADAIQHYLDPAGVGVMVRSRHLCQCHRGVRKEGKMLTSIMRGEFHNPTVKAEFLELVKLSE